MTQRVYLVMDQHGLNHRVYFADPFEAQAYAERCRQPMPGPGRMGPSKPNSYIVVPIVVWDSVAERDACDD
jgi:hypothetical protein